MKRKVGLHDDSDKWPVKRRQQESSTSTGFVNEQQHVPPSKCQQLWINTGLPFVSQVPSIRPTTVTYSTCQTIPVRSHSMSPGAYSSFRATSSSSFLPALPSAVSGIALASSSPVASIVYTAHAQTTTALQHPTVTGRVLVVDSPETTYTTTYF